MIAPIGSILYGQVVDSQKAGYAFGNGEIEITFTELLTTNGEKINLSANKVNFSSEINRTVKISSKVITGALLGTATSVVYALISGGNISKSIAVGAGIGGAGGLINAGLQKGQDIEIPLGTRLQIKFTEVINVNPKY